jgi:hypothetical protein
MITLTESQEALLGTGLLADSILEMDFARRQIIVKKANAG